MCGIAVIWGLSGTPAAQDVLERMTESLRHRGPNDSGYYRNGSVGLGFRRLAILDLSAAAHQPMVSDDGQYVLVFNGAIFNYIELRQELQALGYHFRSSGDSEVLLQAYRHWGVECLSRLNGMWAFVIYDHVHGHLFGSRDRFGVKPLYVYRHPKMVLLASELKAIRASGLYQSNVNWTAAARFLVAGHLDDSTHSFYEGIYACSPGSAFTVDMTGRWQEWRYWRVGQSLVENAHDPAQEFADLFEDTIHLHLRSDVPVGVCLSGGLDSTAIICAATRQRSDTAQQAPAFLQAFCYMAAEYDESAYIAETLALTGAELQILHTNPLDLWNDIRTMLWYQDEPVHTMTAVVGFQLMKLVAASGIRVVLTGQGADEILAGYSSYFLDAWVESLRRAHVRQAWDQISAYTAVHGGQRWRLLGEATLRSLAWELHGNATYRRQAQRKHQRRLQQHPWFHSDFLQHVPLEPPTFGEGTLNQSLHYAVTSAPLPLYLRVEDRNSMAHAVEARLPFLDHRLAELLFGLPPEWKIRGPWNKFLLREAMRQRIPERVRVRADKMGFPTPVHKWFAQELYEPLADLLHSQTMRERGIYHVPAIWRDMERHRQGNVNVANALFRVAEFELLHEISHEQVLSHKSYAS